MSQKVFAIIITFNASKWIDKCFGSLVNSSIPLKILAIDNASTDGTPAIIRKKYPTVEVIETGQNLGFGRANNIGLRIAYEQGSDYFLLLNQDAWIEADTIKKLVNIAQEYTEFGIISPIHLDGEGISMDYNFSLLLCPTYCPDFYSDLYLGKLKDKLYETNFVNAAAWLLSRKCIEIVGGFNPVFFIYGEDDNYVQRLKYHGLRIGVYPQAKIFHDRANREIREDYINQERIFKREILFKYCNPGNPFDISFEKQLVWKIIVKSFFKFKFSQLLFQTKKLKIIRELKLDIRVTKEKSKSKGLTFL